MDERADAELVALARAGDKHAFGSLVERYQQMARRIALGMVAHDDTARELVQEAMLQAYLSLDHLRDDGRFRSWLYGIVLNVCRGYIRDQKTAFLSLESLAGGTRFDALTFSAAGPSPQEVAEAQELHRVILQAVSTLSPKNRAATLMFYYEQLSVHEIAAVLGVSVAAVKGRLHKARDQLREGLLPVYLEMNREVRQGPRRRAMVKVTIADVIRKERTDDETGEPLTQHVVVLLDEVGRRVLPLWVGRWEGEAVAMGLRDLQPPRPMTFSFVASLLNAAGVVVEEVRIESLRETTFYAVVKLRSGDAVREVDARPSDAMALAVRTGSPIYAAEEVMEVAGKDVPAAVDPAQALGSGIDSIVTGLEELWKQMTRSGPAGMGLPLW